MLSGLGGVVPLRLICLSPALLCRPVTSHSDLQSRPNPNGAASSDLAPWPGIGCSVWNHFSLRFSDTELLLFLEIRNFTKISYCPTFYFKTLCLWLLSLGTGLFYKKVLLIFTHQELLFFFPTVSYMWVKKAQEFGALFTFDE